MYIHIKLGKPTVHSSWLELINEVLNLTVTFYSPKNPLSEATALAETFRDQEQGGKEEIKFIWVTISNTETT